MLLKLQVAIMVRKASSWKAGAPDFDAKTFISQSQPSLRSQKSFVAHRTFVMIFEEEIANHAKIRHAQNLRVCTDHLYHLSSQQNQNWKCTRGIWRLFGLQLCGLLGLSEVAYQAREGFIVYWQFYLQLLRWMPRMWPLPMFTAQKLTWMGCHGPAR